MKNRTSPKINEPLVRIKDLKCNDVFTTPANHNSIYLMLTRSPDGPRLAVDLTTGIVSNFYKEDIRVIPQPDIYIGGNLKVL